MNILLTSAGRRAYLVQYFKEALKEYSGKLFASNSTYSTALKYADDFTITPEIYTNEYIDFLIEYCLTNGITVIIPLFDIDLPILAKNKALFKEKNVDVVVSDYNVTQICNDKLRTFSFLKSNGIASPFTTTDYSNAISAINNSELNFPVIVKPRWGMGSIGLYVAENELELSVFIDKTRSDIQNSYLSYESMVDIDNSILIQEYLKGEEFGLDVFNDLKGNFQTCIPKRKLAMRAGETDQAEIIEDRELYQIGSKLACELSHVGNLDVDLFKKDESYYVLELNCRFGGQYPFSHLSGVNFPGALVNLLHGKEIDKKLLTPRYGCIGAKELSISEFKFKNNK